MRLDIDKLDDQIKFLREQAEKLRRLAHRPENTRWAEANAKKMDAIAETLLAVRRDHQMTGMNGRRIDE